VPPRSGPERLGPAGRHAVQELQRQHYRRAGEEAVPPDQQALAAKLQGKAKGKTYEVSIGQHALLQREGTDKIFVVLVEFGNTRHPS